MIEEEHLLGNPLPEISDTPTDPTKEGGEVQSLREKIYDELSYHLPNVHDRDRATKRVLAAIEQDEAEKNLRAYLTGKLSSAFDLNEENTAQVLLDDPNLKIEWAGNA